MPNSAQYWIDQLNLIAHPEGGYYRETYRSELSIAREALPPQFAGARLVSTAIYFLMAGDNFSAFHRLRSDELWHFYAGGAITVQVIEPDGGIAAIGSGGPYAQAAAQALADHTQLSARQIAEEALKIAGRMCIYTNDKVTIEEL